MVENNEGKPFENQGNENNVLYIESKASKKSF